MTHIGCALPKAATRLGVPVAVITDLGTLVLRVGRLICSPAGKGKIGGNAAIGRWWKCATLSPPPRVILVLAAYPGACSIVRHQEVAHVVILRLRAHCRKDAWLNLA